MTKLILFILFLISSLPVSSKEYAFSCNGTLRIQNQGFNVSKDIAYVEDKDKLSVLIKDKKIILSGGTNQLSRVTSVIYDKKNGDRIGSDYSICKNENHELTFNNYSCNFESVKFKETFDIFEGTFNGISNLLHVNFYPSQEKRSRVLKTKGNFEIYNAVYECIPSSSSF